LQFESWILAAAFNNGRLLLALLRELVEIRNLGLLEAGEVAPFLHLPGGELPSRTRLGLHDFLAARVALVFATTLLLAAALALLAAALLALALAAALALATAARLALVAAAALVVAALLAAALALAAAALLALVALIAGALALRLATALLAALAFALVAALLATAVHLGGAAAALALATAGRLGLAHVEQASANQRGQGNTDVTDRLHIAPFLVSLKRRLVDNFSIVVLSCPQVIPAHQRC
jgi:hypothetical protein